MSEPALSPLRFAGREFSSADRERVREITCGFAGLGITGIARTACERREWKRPSGGLKNLECRRLIEHWAGQGLLRLPARRVARTARGESPAEIHGSAREWEPLRLEVVRAGPADHGGDHALYKELLGRHPDLGYRIPFGARLRHLVRSERAAQNVPACLLWSSPAWKMAPRDAWIGGSGEERARNLPYVVNNSRFLILPWARVKGLASRILAPCARQLPADWARLYGYRPLLLETLVDAERFRGPCCRAANGIKRGQTTGGGRMDRDHAAQGAAVKDLFVYPLCRRVQQRLRSAAAPLWREPDEEVRRLERKAKAGPSGSSPPAAKIPVKTHTAKEQRSQPGGAKPGPTGAGALPARRRDGAGARAGGVAQESVRQSTHHPGGVPALPAGDCGGRLCDQRGLGLGAVFAILHRLAALFRGVPGKLIEE